MAKDQIALAVGRPADAPRNFRSVMKTRIASRPIVRRTVAPSGKNNPITSMGMITSDQLALAIGRPGGSVLRAVRAWTRFRKR